MPFTLSHPPAVVALRRTGLPMAAMVSGTVVPDVPMFAHLDGFLGYGFTHSVIGIGTADLALGMLAVLLWCRLLRDPAVDLAPAFVRERLPVSSGYGVRQWRLAPIAVVVGSSTHVGWDEFTHAGRWGDSHVAWLHDQHAGIAGYHWAQTTSSVVGLLVVIGSCVLFLCRRPRVARAAVVPALASRASICVAVVVAAVSIATVSVEAGENLHAIAFAVALVSVAALVVAAVVAAVGWQVLAQRLR